MIRLLAALLLASTTNLSAAFFTGNELYAWLSSEDAPNRVRGMYYVAGVVDTLNDDVLCLPGNVTLGQVRDVVLFELRTRPATRNYQADVLIRAALEPLWACKRGATQGRNT